jgi:hypothetical protein
MTVHIAYDDHQLLGASDGYIETVIPILVYK